MREGCARTRIALALLRVKRNDLQPQEWGLNTLSKAFSFRRKGQLWGRSRMKMADCYHGYSQSPPTQTDRRRGLPVALAAMMDSTDRTVTPPCDRSFKLLFHSPRWRDHREFLSLRVTTTLRVRIVWLCFAYLSTNPNPSNFLSLFSFFLSTFSNEFRFTQLFPSSVYISFELRAKATRGPYDPIPFAMSLSSALGPFLEPFIHRLHKCYTHEEKIEFRTLSRKTEFVNKLLGTNEPDPIECT